MIMNIDLSTCSFPFRLYHMLEEAPRAGFAHIVSWLPEGNGFVVHDREKFSDHVMKTFFSHTKWKSFLRQLNLYSFQRLSKRGPGKGSCYAHPSLIRGQIDKCKHIQRTHVSSQANDASSVKKTKETVLDTGAVFSKQGDIDFSALFAPGEQRSSTPRGGFGAPSILKEIDPTFFLSDEKMTPSAGFLAPPPDASKSAGGVDNIHRLLLGTVSAGVSPAASRKKKGDSKKKNLSQHQKNMADEALVMAVKGIEGSLDYLLEYEQSSSAALSPDPIDAASASSSSGNLLVDDDASRRNTDRSNFSPDMVDAIVSIFLGEHGGGATTTSC